MTPRPTGRLVLAALAAVAAAALTACGTSPLIGSASPAGPNATTSSPTAAAATTTPAPSTSASAAAGAVAAAPAGTAGTTGGARTAGGSGSGGSPSGTGGTTGGGNGSGTGGGNGGGAPSAPAPAIQSFRVVSPATCPVHGTADAPFSSPGGITIAWSVTGADGAAIAVDNPDVYGAYGSSYPAKGQLQLPFGCNASGTTTHTYTVWPAGAKSTSKTITASARSGG